MDVRRVLRIALLTLPVAACGADEPADEEGESDEVAQAIGRAGYAQRIKNSSRVHLTTVHTSGVRDNADAKQNIDDTAAGRDAATSRYGDAGGRRVEIKLPVLRGMWSLQKKYTFTVTEIAGGDHSSGSNHYAGRAIDVSNINGRGVGAGAPHAGFMATCRSLGANEVLGPGDPGHDTHVHCAWE